MAKKCYISCVGALEKLFKLSEDLRNKILVDIDNFVHDDAFSEKAIKNILEIFIINQIKSKPSDERGKLTFK
jgi:hypothetical protein